LGALPPTPHKPLKRLDPNFNFKGGRTAYLCGVSAFDDFDIFCFGGVYMEVINIRENPQYKDEAIAYFQEVWASDASKPVYEDCINRSLATESPLPVWYLLRDPDEDEIIGCAGLITNDFISCMDLWPWLAALYIDDECRGNNYAALLIEAIKKDTAKAGFSKLYLATGHVGYYEKFGFTYSGDGHHPWGESSRVYECVL
jgi:N-acetylglutamate synthase-like GNAT family acetyltransferase